MRDFQKIIKVLKEYISESGRVYDKDVAKLLDISQAQFATLKRRNSTPYVQLLEFCRREELCCSEIFFD